MAQNGSKKIGVFFLLLSVYKEKCFQILGRMIGILYLKIVNLKELLDLPSLFSLSDALKSFSNNFPKCNFSVQLIFQ
jgi:hypothetical protein